uniref:RING-type E3 ubiquitin transferase n=1 Tax=Kalanchoe fedtschenkoi TaxID=63787 RepID=A0A7N0VAF7_KALFE
MDDYSPTPVGKDTVVAIAVTKGRNSQAALKWTVENLLMEGHSLSVVHVRPPAPVFHQNKTMARQMHLIEAYSGTDVRRGLDDGYKDILNTRAQEMLQPFQSYCRRKNIQSDLVVLEDADIAKALADFVLTKDIDVLVMGAGSRSGIVKKLMGPAVSSRVLKKIPYFCTLYMIGKGKLQFVKHASSISHTVPGQDSDVHEHDNSISGQTVISPLTLHGSSVSAFPSDTVKEFEFRSPLKDFGHSDFRVGEYSSSESDISFASSDTQFSDGTAYTWSTNSGWSLDSFASHSSSSTENSGWNEWSSGSSHASVEYLSMDELHRLQEGLMRTCSPPCEMRNEMGLTSKLNMLDLNDNQPTKRMQKLQKSISRMAGGRFESPVRSADINLRVDEEEAPEMEGH